jgi:hypothetical protein
MSSVVIAGDTSGSITLAAPAISGSTTLTLPTTTGVLFASNTSGWSVTPSGTTLYFNYNGTNVAKLDSTGNLTTKANITAYGTV